MGALLAIVLLTVGVAYLYSEELDKALDGVERADLWGKEKEEKGAGEEGSSGLATPDAEAWTHPPRDPAQGHSFNALLLGTDSSDLSGNARSDSLMVVHVPSDRQQVFVMSIPRDLRTVVPGQAQTHKINAAYSLGGPGLTAATVEGLLGVPMDQVALVDFDGFTDLIDEVRGVTVANPFAGCDTSNNAGYCWEEGKIELDSASALKYVRWRTGLPNGDLDRGQNQQRVLRAIVDKVMSPAVVSSPQRFGSTVTALTKHVVLDQSFTNDEIRGLLLSLRFSGGDDLKSFTYPIAGYGSDPRLGSVVLWDEARGLELVEAFQNDTVRAYWLEHKDDPIAGVATVE